jgi:SlyX protein
MNERIEKLEERVAHQEHSIQMLGDEIFQQQQQLEKLHLLVKELSERFRNLADSGASGSNLDEPPPHY